jgi:hypothetical protein
MASSFTANKRIEKPGNNDYVNTWNVPVNANFDAIDQALGGVTFLNATGAVGTVTLLDTQYRSPMLFVSGAMTGNAVYRIPAGVGGVWVVRNVTTGTSSVTISSAGGGTTIVVPRDQTVIVFSDGTNIRRATASVAAGAGLSVSAAEGLFTVSLDTPVPTASGGTGQTSYADGEFLIGTSAGGLAKATLTAGPGVSIANGSGAVTISSTLAGGTVTSVAAGAGLTATPTNPITGSGTISLANTNVAPGTYNFATITVDAQGRVTSAASGSVAPSFAPGTRMLFQQTSAPTGWTKDTGLNNRALRIVSGAAGSGGSLAFTDAFTSRTPSGSIAGHALTIAEMPNHTHTYSALFSTGPHPTGTASNEARGTVDTGTTSAIGGGQAHTHGLTLAAMDFAVAYTDVIVAVKD